VDHPLTRLAKLSCGGDDVIVLSHRGSVSGYAVAVLDGRSNAPCRRRHPLINGPAAPAAWSLREGGSRGAAHTRLNGHGGDSTMRFFLSGAQNSLSAASLVRGRTRR